MLLPSAHAKRAKGIKLDRGNGNTGAGTGTLFSLTTGLNNTAVGFNALASNAAPNFNTATGTAALASNTAGSDNTADGNNALNQNASGNGNTATGSNALFNNATGDRNTADGSSALFHNATGRDNTAIGFQSLSTNINGTNNVALGSSAGFFITGDYNINIGIVGKPENGDESYTIRIGDPFINTDAYIAGIYGANAPGGSAVYVNSDGKLGINLSSARFKQQVQNMADASSGLLSLRPVTFRYKPEIDPHGIPQFGLVAEEVEKINPDLVARDAEGKVLTVRYDAVNAMLLNEFLKEHGKVQEQQAAIAQLESKLARQEKAMEAITARLKQQDSEIQKVRARLETGEAARRTVSNQ